MLELGRPNFLQKVSLSDSLQTLVPQSMYPHKPENYVLLSQESAIADWHVVFSETAVYYHVVKAVKEIAFVEPTAQNKLLFGKYLDDEK